MEAEDQELLWCIDCLRCHGPECPHHGEVTLIKDTPTVSRALASLPNSLHLQTIDGERQVIARQTIARRTLFGPLEATEVTSNEGGSEFILKIFKKDGQSVILDTSDEMRCNWMSLVTIATAEANQNLIVYQYKGGLYFTVTKDIQAGEALRVWYAPHYAAKLQQPLLKETSQSVNVALTSNNTEKSITPTSKETEVIGSCGDRIHVSNELTEQKLRKTPQKKRSKRSSVKTKKKKALSESDKPNQPTSSSQKHASSKTSCASQTVEHLSDAEYRLLQERILGESVRSCHGCSLLLDSTEQLKHHIETVHKQDPVQCPQCAKICLTKQHLLQHVECMHTDNTSSSTDDIQDATIGCPLCDRCLSTTGALRLHHQLLHIDNFKCSLCQRTFWNQTKYLLHVKDHKMQGAEAKTVTTFTCDKCSKEFTSSTGLKIHESSVHMDKMFSCSFCDYSALTELTLHEHILSNHPDNGLGIPESQKLYCDKCNGVFLRLGTLNRHLLNHKVVEFKCEKCGKIYRRKDSLKKHNCMTSRSHTLRVDTITDHTCNTANVYECQVCLKMYSNRSSMKYHAQTHGEKNYTCDICNKEFHKRFNFDSHKFQHLRLAKNVDGIKELIQVEDRSDEVHSCHLCPCHFTKMQPLINHFQKYHSLTSAPAICIPCQRIFPSKEDLSSHEAEHTLIPLPNNLTCDNFHSCPTCCKVFMSESNLQSHMVVHADHKNHVCEFCGSRFRRPDGLKQHIKTHHSEHLDSSQKTDSTCLICSKSFKVASSLRHHMLLHTNQRNYQCPHCDYSFIQRGNFNRHVMGHGVEKPVTCDVCNRVFKRSENLRRHMLVHKVYQYSCQFCYKKFSTQHFLTNHIKKVHEGEESCQCEYCGTTFTALNSYRRHMKLKHNCVSRQEYAPIIENR